MENSKYKNKYLKYKNKYLQLKQSSQLFQSKQHGGNEPFISKINSDNQIEEYRKKLSELYPSTVFDTNKNNQRNYSQEYNTTYGEMTYEGIDLINKKCNPNDDINVFVDIGSGRGKLVLWYASEPNINKSIGIELVEERHQDALKVKEQIGFKEITDKVELIGKNFLDIDFKTLINPYSKVLIWLSNLCFNQDITDKVFDKITKDFPVGTIICCSKQTSNPNIKFIESITVPMSWSSGSNVYIYKI